MCKFINNILLLFILVIPINISGKPILYNSDEIINFTTEENKFINEMSNAKNRLELLQIHSEYKKFLNISLEKYYKRLLKILKENDKVLLKKSQKSWFDYKNNEESFISSNWSKSQYEREHVLTLSDNITRQRVLAILAYLSYYSYKR